MFRRTLAALALALTATTVAPAALTSTALAPLQTVADILAPAAHADPVPAGAGDVSILGILPARTGNGLEVTLSNGARDMLHPCRFEDGRHCYWIAGTRGNGRGRDYIVTRGRIFYVPNLAAALPRTGGAR